MPLFGPAFLPLVHAAVCVATSGSLRRLFSKRRIYSPFRRFPARENHPAGLRSRIHRKAPGYSLSRSHIHPAKVPFCATRRLSFAAETVLFPVLLGLCLSNSEIFLAANPFLLRREFFLLFCQNSARPMSKDSSVALRFFLRQQDLLLAHTAMVVSARRGGKVPGPSIFPCAGGVAFPHILPWSCPPGEGCVHYTRSLPRIVWLWQPSMNAQASGGLCPSSYTVRLLYHRIFAGQGGSHFQSISSAVL